MTANAAPLPASVVVPVRGRVRRPRPERAPRARRGARRRRLGLLAAALLVVMPTGAGDPELAPLTEKQAVKAFGKQVKVDTSAFRKAALAAVKTLDADLDALEAALDQGALTPAQLANALLPPLEGFVQTLTAQSFAAVVGLEDAAEAQLDQAAGLAGLPDAFQVGADGPADRVAERVAKAVELARRKAVRRVQRFRKFAAKAHGLGVNVVLEPTPLTQPLAPVLAETSVPLVNFPFALEVLFAVSELEATGDGVLGFAVLVPGNMGDELSTILLGPGLFAPGGPWLVDGAGRARGLLAGLDEGSYKLVVDRQGTQVARSISVP